MPLAIDGPYLEWLGGPDDGERRPVAVQPARAWSEVFGTEPLARKKLLKVVNGTANRRCRVGYFADLGHGPKPAERRLDRQRV
jgi:hypothetical protein